jgi:peroxiredoxin
MTIDQRAEVIAPLEVGRRLPPFRPPLTTGGELALSAYRARANLAIFVLPAGDEPMAATVLTGVAERQADYRERHAQPLAIVGGPVEAVSALQRRLALPYPVAADPDGRVVARLAPRAVDGRLAPVALLADRYAELRAQEIGWPALAPTGQANLLEWLTYIDCLCSC